MSNQDISKNTLSTPTPGATVSIDASLGNLFKWTAGENETINITGGQQAGRMITLMVVNDAIVPRTITMGAGIVSTGALIGASSKTSVTVLQSDGTRFYELSRTRRLGP